VSASFFLVDECLSPRLAAHAQQRGYEATHVVHFGLTGSPDWKIVRMIRSETRFS
jgi:predicted nuclease of predicted toxin-antitoxin system